MPSVIATISEIIASAAKSLCMFRKFFFKGALAFLELTPSAMVTIARVNAIIPVYA
jgi:hypothetical protein